MTMDAFHNRQNLNSILICILHILELNGLLPYGEDKGDKEEEIDSKNKNVTLTLSRETMFLTKLVNTVTVILFPPLLK